MDVLIKFNYVMTANLKQIYCYFHHKIDLILQNKIVVVTFFELGVNNIIFKTIEYLLVNCYWNVFNENIIFLFA